MTSIIFTKTSDDNYKSIECNGHAGFAEYGSDIVCSAISVLTINTINSLDNLTKDEISVFQDEDKGIIRFEFKDTPSHDAELLVRSFELGIESIYQQYGKKYLNIKFRRE
ncbi:MULTISPECIES: ribosomal-processing cysteine protease Prp [unclassified Butyrivibrio]|uniref:ribosomal-processing cysteine protease Prp n=1 Tax=unclassified Butyrivibrio TaxID=2639466 RepID=UPI0003B629F7|nr:MULTISPECIES: ribosomal-processing cysteine protease Prp [unclassified Butyrivibrio]MDC7295241.1 ribosomal-processing cysteine protease Prp [Butyrivibrio sp. DSM 10294]